MKLLRNLFIAILPLTLSATVLAEMQTLKTEDGQSFNVYVAGPEDSKRGVLLIHGWLGLNKGVQGWADTMSEKGGYRAMAIDVFNGKTADNPDDAKKLVAAVNQDEANAKYKAALNALTTADRKVAVFGKSYGGSQALHATLAAPELVSATVSYYPFQEMLTDKKALMALKSPVLIEVGDKDFAFTVEKVEAFKAAMENAGRELVINTYQAGHGFDQPISKNYDEKVKDAAHQSTREFLQMQLK